MTIAAAKAGKDIYCEKPLSLTVEQGRAMVKAVQQYNRILQTGSQHRSGPSSRLACELVRNGRIGRLERITTTVPVNNAVDPGPGWKPMPVPEGFDYETWLGPAPLAPYHEGRCLYRFRFNLDYSGGQVTNFGAHAFDVAQWGHGTDRSGPVEFEDTGSEWPVPGSLYNVATKVSFRARYADGVELTCQTIDKGSYTKFEGTEGWVQYSSGKLQTYPESLKTSKIGPDEIHLPIGNPRQTEDRYANYLPDHVRNFLDCIKSRQEPIGSVELGHRTASICNLGNIAMRLKRKFRWDPDKEEILGDSEAAPCSAGRCGRRGICKRSNQPDAPVLMLRYLPFSPELGIGENGEALCNGRIIEISPAEEGASPWLWSPIRYRVSRGGLARWG